MLSIQRSTDRPHDIGIRTVTCLMASSHVSCQKETASIYDGKEEHTEITTHTTSLAPFLSLSQAMKKPSLSRRSHLLVNEQVARSDHLAQFLSWFSVSNRHRNREKVWETYIRSFQALFVFADAAYIFVVFNLSHPRVRD